VTDVLDRSACAELARHSGAPSASIYLPAHRLPATEGRTEDPIRLKNLIAQADAELRSTGMRGTQVDALLRPAYDLLGDHAFWRHAGAEGIAAFAAPDFWRIMRFGAPMPEQVVVGDRFYLRPLFEAPTADQPFAVLAISRNSRRLFVGTAKELNEVDLGEASDSLADELRFDQREESLQFDSHGSPESAAGVSRGQVAYHGQGGARDQDKSDLGRYLQSVENEVTDVLMRRGEPPLVLAGVAYEIATYRGVNRYRNTVEAQLETNPDRLSPDDLCKRAVEVLAPTFAVGAKNALDELGEKLGTGLASDDITEILPAAAAGRVKTLLFDDSVGPFGHFEESSLSVEVLGPEVPRLLRATRPAEEPPGDGSGWDLVDLAAAETCTHAGDVFAFWGEAAPVRGVAAVFRY
jgi:hypothetical protein